MSNIYMTKEGYKKMMDDLNHLESVERPAISMQISEARDKGDLSENAEYDAAKEAQGLLELRISQLKNTVKNARIISEKDLNTDYVQILNKVRIRNIKTNQEFTYMLVSEQEASLKDGKLAISTPVAKALLGKKIGDKVEVSVPSGQLHFEVIDISF
ncbi:MAG: transcription elongation factor GreA [Paludibacteraceae bacterium]|nr:transcription elongation factor GreA [Paludibacteraceae bacterium]MBP6284127.1 transcription elongation factor GreA [Paludibacteraceae bacterium]